MTDACQKIKIKIKSCYDYMTVFIYKDYNIITDYNFKIINSEIK